MGKKKGLWRSDAAREALIGYLFIAPWLLGFLAFFAGPIVASLLLSFTKWDIVSPPHWVGLRNYHWIFTHDTDFYQAVKVTLKYSAIYLPLEIVMGVAVAMAMNLKARGIGIFRTLFYLPYVVPAVASVLVWVWILNPHFGLLDTLLKFIGIGGPNWFGDPAYALWGIVMISLWTIGGSAIIYLAGLQNIPPQLYEAAEIDGANGWQQFWHVTIPMLTPTLFFKLVLGLIGTFQTFTSAFVATKGGPMESTLFYMLYIYNKAFVSLKMGYGSALAWILTLIILVVTLTVFKSSPYWVHYEAERK